MADKIINAEFTFNIKLRPINLIIEEVLAGVMLGFEKFAKIVVDEAVRISLAKGIIDTGKNFKSIGWAKSPVGRSTFDNLRTFGLGDLVVGTLLSQRRIVEVIVATSSGYGGWLEVGTRKFRGRTFITASALRNLDSFRRVMKDTV